MLHERDGRVGFLVNGEWNEVGPGDAAFTPHGVIHTFKNVGDQPSTMVITTIPSGIEKSFARCAAEFAIRTPSVVATALWAVFP